MNTNNNDQVTENIKKVSSRELNQVSLEIWEALLKDIKKGAVIDTDVAKVAKRVAQPFSFDDEEAKEYDDYFATEQKILDMALNRLDSMIRRGL